MSTFNTAKALATAVKELEYGTEAQIDCFNALCELAVDCGFEEQVEDYAHGATDIEIADFIMDLLK